MKVREIVKLLQEDGWYLIRIRGSHQQFKHPKKPGKVTVPGNGNQDLHPGTLASTLRQSQLKEVP